MANQAEIDFENRIDCNFPYSDRDACISLIEDSLKISPNAVFKVVEELCRIPFSEREFISETALLDMLGYLDKRFEHQLKEVVFDTAAAMIKKEQLTVDETLRRMHLVSQFDQQYNALAILYDSCDDIDGRLEPIWQSITQKWNST